MAKHEVGLSQLITKKQKLSLSMMFIVFAGLGIIVSFASYVSGLVLFLIGMMIPLGMIYSVANKKFTKVVRMEIIDNVPRVSFEYWSKSEVEELPREYFWRHNNKPVPVIDDTGDERHWFDPFTNQRIPAISSGDLYRTLNQESARILMQNNQSQWSEVAKIGLLGLLALGIGLYLIVVLNKTDEPRPALSNDPITAPVIESVPDYVPVGGFTAEQNRLKNNE